MRRGSRREVIKILEDIQDAFIKPVPEGFEDDMSHRLAVLNIELAMQVDKLPPTSCVYRLAMMTCQQLTREVGGLDLRIPQHAVFARKLWKYVEDKK